VLDTPKQGLNIILGDHEGFLPLWLSLTLRNYGRHGWPAAGSLLTLNSVSLKPAAIQPVELSR
jgi:hypothetical protein